MLQSHGILTTKHKNAYKLGGLYQLKLGQLYQQQCLKDIKQQLEAIHGVKLQKATTDYFLVFVCKNGVMKTTSQVFINKDSENTNFFHQQNKTKNTQNTQNKFQGCACGYFIKFSIQFRSLRSLYKLQSYSIQHQVYCFDIQQAHFLRNKRQLCLQTETIMKIVAHQRARRREINNPKLILDILCTQTGLPSNFIFEGVSEDKYKRKLKKKLDNIIGEAKKAEINVLHYLSDQQFFNLYSQSYSNILNGITIKESEQNKDQSIIISNTLSAQQLNNNTSLNPKTQQSLIKTSCKNNKNNKKSIKANKKVKFHLQKTNKQQHQFIKMDEQYNTQNSKKQNQQINKSTTSFFTCTQQDSSQIDPALISKQLCLDLYQDNNMCNMLCLDQKYQNNSIFNGQLNNIRIKLMKKQSNNQGIFSMPNLDCCSNSNNSKYKEKKDRMQQYLIKKKLHVL